MSFSTKLIRWYEIHKRDLPWRTTQDPYKIWLSEIILQQTRVQQGLPYFEAFSSQFPTIVDLAKAPEDEILKTWQGLGYYSRARNLHHTAKFIAKELNGKFPSTYDTIIQLKGIGPYTAAAIASFCFHQPVPVIDGNVMRIISRIFGVDGDVQSALFKKRVYELLLPYAHKKTIAIFNQALMEFGSLQCIPGQPNCSVCIFKNECFAFKNNCVDQLPPKKVKITKKQRYFDYVWILDAQNHVFLKKRAEKDIWQGLYEPFLIESDAFTSEEMVLDDRILLELKKIGTTFEISPPEKTYKHVLSHQQLHIRFWTIKIHPKKKNKDFISLLEASQKGMPIVVRTNFEQVHK